MSQAQDHITKLIKSRTLRVEVKLTDLDLQREVTLLRKRLLRFQVQVTTTKKRNLEKEGFQSEPSKIRSIMKTQDQEATNKMNH